MGLGRNPCLYHALEDTIAKGVSDGVLSAGAAARGTYSHGSSWYAKVSVIGKYFSACEYDANETSFHHWPWGNGTDTCKYATGCQVCEYSDGTVSKAYSLSYAGASHGFLLGLCSNDNSEETRIYVDGAQWLNQVNSGHKVKGQALSTTLPASLQLWGNKTWSRVTPVLWYAVADGNPSVTTSDEPPDVNATLELNRTYVRPKLSFTAADVALSNSNPTAGTPVTIYATIHNNGDDEARDVSVFFYVDRVIKSQKFIGSSQITIPAHSSATASVVWNAISGTHTIRAIDTFNSGDQTSCGSGGAVKTLTVP